jgi:succinate dehydrogenase / fumarate reductase cytochrome b subunit
VKESILPVSPVPPRIQAPERPRREVAINQIAALWDSMIGKKVVMAITGAVLVLFVIMHMIGNLKILSGPDNINAYAVFLREVGRPELGYGQLLWIVRIILLICVILQTTIAAQTMRCGGVVLLAFIIFHLLHLTAGAVGFRPGQFKHLAVYQNVIAGLSSWPVAIFYIVAMAALSMHLHHGIWSAFQTLGFNTSRNTRILQTLCRLIALAVFLGFVSVPVSVLAGWLR